MITKVMKLADINPAPYNPRVTLEPGSVQYEALKNSLTKFGIVEPLIVNDNTGNLVGGHQRMNVLHAMGVEEAEVVVVNLTENEERLLNIGLNKIEGEWDFEKLDELFTELDPEDIEYTGFDISEIGVMYAEEEVEEKYVEPAKKKEPEEEEEPELEEEFEVYLSFPSKETAVRWLRERHIDKDFEGTRSVNIQMDGVEYDRDN